MAQRRSKTKKKQPELRTGGGRSAKQERSRTRAASAARSAPAGPRIRVRPAGAVGVLATLLLAAVAIAGLVWGAARLGRWNELSTPDSLWLVVVLGAFAAVPAVAGVARSRSDVDLWGALALLVPLGLLVAERYTGPDCPPGGDCAAVGARGWFGLPVSVLVIVAFAAVGWILGRLLLRRVAERRPRQGRVSLRIALSGMLTSLILWGVPISAAGLALDTLVRKEPARVRTAKSDVAKYCFQLGAAPKLSVRPSPDGVLTSWTTFAVRRANESRPGIGTKSLPDFAGLDTVYPYEASVSYDGDGALASLACRKVTPDSGNATAADLVQGTPESNPLDPATTAANFRPNFYTQGPPKAEAKQPAATAKKSSTAKKTAAK